MLYQKLNKKLFYFKRPLKTNKKNYRLKQKKFKVNWKLKRKTYKNSLNKLRVKILNQKSKSNKNQILLVKTSKIKYLKIMIINS